MAHVSAERPSLEKGRLGPLFGLLLPWFKLVRAWLRASGWGTRILIGRAQAALFGGDTATGRICSALGPRFLPSHTYLSLARGALN